MVPDGSNGTVDAGFSWSDAIGGGRPGIRRPTVEPDLQVLMAIWMCHFHRKWTKTLPKLCESFSTRS
jgi:hypothetical protein